MEARNLRKERTGVVVSNKMDKRFRRNGYGNRKVRVIRTQAN